MEGYRTGQKGLFIAIILHTQQVMPIKFRLLSKGKLFTCLMRMPVTRRQYYYFYYFKGYLFESYRGNEGEGDGRRKGGRKRKRASFHPPVTSQIATKGGTGLGQNWESRTSRFNGGQQGPSTWTIFSYFPSHISRELHQQQDSQDLNWHPDGMPEFQPAA